MPPEKIELIYDSATRVPTRLAAPEVGSGGLRIVSMGNIGYSQGLTALVRVFEPRPDLTAGASLVITGTGVAAEKARAKIRTRQVKMLGMVDDVGLEAELLNADVALVSQRYSESEFNIPSKLMSFLHWTARSGQRSILAVSWRRSSVNPARAGSLTRATRTLFRRGRAARTWRFLNVRLACDEMFDQDAFANSFERTL